MDTSLRWAEKGGKTLENRKVPYALHKMHSAGIGEFCKNAYCIIMHEEVI